MKMVIHRTEDRGAGEYGWLSTRYSFSFANWYNPDRLGFGALLVINDDTIAPGMGFGAHQHDNMEIITVVTEGSLAHKDSMGNEGVVQAGEVQVMSAGTGITHSEFNASKTESVHLFQIWIESNVRNVEPRYDQKFFTATQGLQSLVGPIGTSGVLGIHQDAFVSKAILTQENTLEYRLHSPNNGVYVFVMKGDVTVGDVQLHERDALGVIESDVISLSTIHGAEILLIEVPVKG